MNFTIYLFYIFSFVLVSSSLVVVSTRNMVYAVMFLILAFFNAAGLFLILGAEFIAMLLIIVYVGAIAVLFLFVVMMLNIDIKITQEINRKRPLLMMISGIFLFEVIMTLTLSKLHSYDPKILYPIKTDITNTYAIGSVLYTDFILPFQLCGAILFVAMIGAIVLTLKEDNRFVKKQIISNQVLRTKSNSLETIKVKSNTGIDI